MKLKNRPFRIMLAGLALLPSVLACSLSREALVVRERRDPPPPAVLTPAPFPPWPKIDPVPEGQQRLLIHTRPLDAQVFIDKRYYGQTPLTLGDFPFGKYYLEMRKNGYEPYAAWIDFNKNAQEFLIALTREEGMLEVKTVPPDARVTAADRTLEQGANPLPVGAYTVTVQAFGYATRTVEVQVTARRTVPLNVALERTAFTVSGVSLSRSAFNPRRPGPAAETALFFSVSGPGSGRVSVRDEGGREIAGSEVERFEEPEQCVRWNGLNQAGEPAEDGRYTIAIRARGINETAWQEASAAVRIDTGLSLENQSLWSGAAGLCYAPSPSVLPAGSFELAAVALTRLDQSAFLTSPAAVGARVGLGDRQELNASLAALLSNQAPPDLSAGLSYRWQFLAGPAGGIALLAKISYHLNARGDLFANATGVSLGLPTRLSLGPFSVFVSPEFILGLYKVTDDPASAVPGAYPWFYGRCGLGFTEGIVSLGASVSLRTASLDEGFAIALPVPTALEITVYLPESPLYLTAIGVVEWGAAAQWVWAGIGFGLLW